MANKYITTQQYEPLRAPSGWGTDERRLLQQLTDRFDDLYSKFNRLRFEDLGDKLRSRFETVEGYSTEIEQNAHDITLKANSADVSTALNLKADSATLTSVNNNLQSQINAVPGQITLEVGKVRAGANILLQSNIKTTSQASEYVFKTWDLTDILKPNTTYALSMFGRVVTGIAGHRLVAYVYYIDGATITWGTEIYTGDVTNSLKTAVFTTPANPVGTPKLTLYNRNANEGTVYCDWVTLIEGNTPAASWIVCPDDPANSVSTTYIQLLEGLLRMVTGGTMSIEGASVDIATDMLTIQNLAKTKVMLEVANGRVNSDVLACPKIIGNVVNTFPGGTIPWTGDPQTSIANIGKYFLADGTLTIPAGTYNGNMYVWGIHGARLNIVLSSGVVFNGYISITGCSGVTISAAAEDTTQIIGTSDAVIYVRESSLELSNLHITGKERTSAASGSYWGVYAIGGVSLNMTGCTIDRIRSYCLIANQNCRVNAVNCKGGVAGGDYLTLANLGTSYSASNGSTLAYTGTMPIAATQTPANTNSWITGSATPTATTGAVQPAPSTRTYAVSTGYTVKTTTDGSSSVSWASGEPRQGSLTERVFDYFMEYLIGYHDVTYNGFGALLLTNAANIVSDRPVGKSITSATMKIRRDAEAGTSGAIVCTLYQHNYTSAPSGAPNNVLFAQAADAINISPNQELTIVLNTSALAALNAGTCKGFGFKNTGGYGRYDIYGELVVMYG